MTTHNLPTGALRNRGSLYPWMIALALLGFEVFQFSSDYAALHGMIGVASWALCISFGLCAIDFAGLSKLNSSQIYHTESYGFLAGAWILSALGENFLTFIVVSHSAIARASSSILVTSGVISYNTWTMYIPIFIALVSWGVQVLLVTRLEKEVDAANLEKEIGAVTLIKPRGET